MSKLGLASLGILLVYACSLFIAGCDGPGFGENISPADLNILRVAKASDPQAFDPALIQDVDTTDEMQQIYQGLTKWGQNLAIEPCLAKNWKILNGGRTYIFNLRQDVSFSNGDPFDASCVQFSLDRVFNPALKSPVAAEYLGDIVGTSGVISGATTHISGVKILGKYTVEININRPIAYFLGKFAYSASWIVDPKVTPFNQPILDPTKAVGTGPFVCNQYSPGSLLELRPNPQFWGDKPSIGGVRYVIAKQPTVREDLFMAHQVDIVGLSSPEATEIQADPELGPDLHTYPMMALMYFAMNQTQYEPFKNRHLRRAVAYAIDDSEMVNEIGGKINRLATGILPPGVLGYRPSTEELGYNPALALKELHLAGYRDGSELPVLKIYISGGNLANQRYAEVIQNDLIKNLHMQVELAALDAATLNAKVDARQLPAYIYGWYADYPDPQDFISLFFTTGGTENRIGYVNPTVDEICAKADYMPERSKARLALYDKAEDLILQDAPWKPICFVMAPELIDKRVTNLQQSIYGHAPVNSVVIKNN